VHAALRVRRRVEAQIAGARLGEARGAAVTSEVSLVEDFNESVLAVALDGAGIADTGSTVGVRWLRRRRVAGQTGENTLPQRAQRLCTVINALEGRVS
jgi:hypothetical protein